MMQTHVRADFRFNTQEGCATLRRGTPYLPSPDKSGQQRRARRMLNGVLDEFRLTCQIQFAPNILPV